MRTTRIVPAAFVLVLATTGCRTNDSDPTADVLPTATEMDLSTPEEEAERAALEITDENLDAEYERLLAELEAEEG